MSVKGLPEDGELRLGEVRLPAGRRVLSGDESGPVAWVTDVQVPDAGRVWLSLSAELSGTGLQPVLFADSADFLDFSNWPADVADVAGVDVAAVLAELWERRGVWKYPEEYEPFTVQFPGLAPAAGERLADGEIEAALDGLGPAYVGLVTAGRPADVLPVTGAFDDPLPLAAVLRSWEDRFGARLVRLIPDEEMRLLVERPPRTPEAALAVAAEHWAFCNAWIDESGGERVDLMNIPDIAARVAGSPIWAFWWD